MPKFVIVSQPPKNKCGKWESGSLVPSLPILFVHTNECLPFVYFKMFNLIWLSKVSELVK